MFDPSVLQYRSLNFPAHSPPKIYKLKEQFCLSQKQLFQSEGRLQKGKGNFMHTVTVQHIVNKLLKPSRVLLSMHKPFELVFLICLGWQPFVQAEYDMRAYRHNTDCSLMSTLPLHTKTQLWHYSLIIPHRHGRANSHMGTRLLAGYGWMALKHCSGSSDDLAVINITCPSSVCLQCYNSKFPRRHVGALPLCPLCSATDSM